MLYTHNGATVEQCDALLEELDEFCQLIENTAFQVQYAELIDQYRVHFVAYQDYIRRTSDFPTYESYLNAHNIPWA